MQFSVKISGNLQSSTKEYYYIFATVKCSHHDEAVNVCRVPIPNTECNHNVFAIPFYDPLRHNIIAKFIRHEVLISAAYSQCLKTY